MGGLEGRLRLWDFEQEAGGEFDTERAGRVLPMAVNPDGNRLVIEHQAEEEWEPKHLDTLWQYDAQKPISEFPHWVGGTRRHRLSRRGDFATVHTDGSFTLVRAGARSRFRTAGVPGKAEDHEARGCPCMLEYW